MMIFARRIKHPLNVSIERSYDANACQHRRPALAFGDQDQDFNGSLPLLELLFGLRELLDISGGILEGYELAAAGQRDRIVEPAFPTPVTNGRQPLSQIADGHFYFDRSPTFLSIRAPFEKRDVEHCRTNGLKHVGVHETGLDRTCSGACAYYALGSGFFRTGSLGYCNAEPGRSCARAWQSCSAAFRRAIDDRLAYRGRSSELRLDQLGWPD
jgi:hypothetical protein